MLLAGCRQDMQDQPKFSPQQGSTFFADGRSVREQVVGTIARSQRDEDYYFTTGMSNGTEGDGMPLRVTLGLLERGQERFNIFCAPCHSRVGNGKGMIVQRGYMAAADLHTDRLRLAPLGHFFTVITNGYGAMPSYSAELSPSERWAVVTYIRALQLSQNAQATDVEQGIRPVPMQVQVARVGFQQQFLGDWVGEPVSIDVPTVQAQAPAQETTPEVPNAQESENFDALKNLPVTPSRGNVAKGAVLYQVKCAVCHQKTREGHPPMIPSLNKIVDRVGEAKVRQVSKDGVPHAKPPMPANPQFTPGDLDDLIAFLRS